MSDMAVDPADVLSAVAFSMAKANDPINPNHYKQGKFEVIEIIEDQKLNYHRGNAIKYICRAGRKDPTKEVEDLKKAIWYIERDIKRLQGAT